MPAVGLQLTYTHRPQSESPSVSIYFALRVARVQRDGAQHCAAGSESCRLSYPRCNWIGCLYLASGSDPTNQGVTVMTLRVVPEGLTAASAGVEALTARLAAAHAGAVPLIAAVAPPAADPVSLQSAAGSACRRSACGASRPGRR